MLYDEATLNILFYVLYIHTLNCTDIQMCLIAV